MVAPPIDHRLRGIRHAVLNELFGQISQACVWPGDAPPQLAVKRAERRSIALCSVAGFENQSPQKATPELVPRLILDPSLSGLSKPGLLENANQPLVFSNWWTQTS
jgi:hypothetical protein